MCKHSINFHHINSISLSHSPTTDQHHPRETFGGSCQLSELLLAIRVSKIKYRALTASLRQWALFFSSLKSGGKKPPETAFTKCICADNSKGRVLPLWAIITGTLLAANPHRAKDWNNEGCRTPPSPGTATPHRQGHGEQVTCPEPSSTGPCPTRRGLGSCVEPGKVAGLSRALVSRRHSTGCQDEEPSSSESLTLAGTRWSQQSQPDRALGWQPGSGSESPGETSAIGSMSAFPELWEEGPAFSFAEFYLQLTEVNKPTSSTKAEASLDRNLKPCM